MIAVRNLTIQFSGFALRNVSLTAQAGAYAMLMGPTGCGKTTILEAICGLRPVAGGTIELMGCNITRAKPGERGIGYVPQDGALFPTMKVRDQLAFALKVRKRPTREISERVRELGELLAIGHLLDRKPRGLSGGERQRVALGRALSSRPAVLCLDEPLNALDDDTRQRMVELLKHVQQRENLTVLHVTHSREEAAKLGSLVFSLNEGSVVPSDSSTQVGCEARVEGSQPTVAHKDQSP